MTDSANLNSAILQAEINSAYLALKIVSLLPSATEIIDCLGLTNALVGRSHECDYPPSIKDLPVCTEARLDSHKNSGEIDADVQTLMQKALSIYKIKTEVLEQLQPTHIITQDQCDVCAVNLPEVERAIAKLTNSYPQIISLQPDLLNEVWDDIKRVAQTLGVDFKLPLDKLQSRIKAIANQVKDKSEKPTVVAIEWTEPLMVGVNWIPELIEIAGGKSLLSLKGQHSPYISWENLVDADPDVIVIMPCGFDLERTEQESQVLTQHPNWNSLKAVKNGQVFVVDGNAYFNRPGPRLVDSAEILAEIFHPQLFDFGYQGISWKPFF
jgi:iron complex transport system substrate-binding protein